MTDSTFLSQLMFAGSTFAEFKDDLVAKMASPKGAAKVAKIDLASIVGDILVFYLQEDGDSDGYCQLNDDNFREVIVGVAGTVSRSDNLAYE